MSIGKDDNEMGECLVAVEQILNLRNSILLQCQNLGLCNKRKITS